MKNRFLEIRLKLGYKYAKDFASFLDISRSTYSRFENNKDQPGAEELFYAAKKLKIKMEDIIYEEEEPKE